MKKGISSDALKWIAVVTMFIDHIGAAVLEKSPLYQTEVWFRGVDIALRYIGRLAFPIYCFLLVEGFFHTRSRMKYFCNLAIFTLLSEIPFDLAFCGEITFAKQNVYYTLVFGYLAMWGMEYFNSRKKQYMVDNFAGESILVLGIMAIIAQLLNTDYGMAGVILIGILWGLRHDKRAKCFLGSLILWNEITHVIAFVLVYYYNGKRKLKRGKYLFYAFYPLHLLLLYFVSQMLW